MSSLSVSHGQDNSLQVGVQGALSIQPSLAASLAVPVLDVTILVAGSSLSLNMGSLAVSSGGNNILQVGDLSQQLIGPSGAAELAVPVLDVAILVAGSGVSLNMDNIVGNRNDDILEVGDLSQILVSPDALAVGAVPVSDVTGSVAGSSDSINGHDVVVLVGDDTSLVGHLSQSLVSPSSAAELAVPVLDIAGAATGSLNSLNMDDVVLSSLVGQLAAQHAVSVASVEVLVLASGLEDGDIIGQDMLAVSLVPVHVVDLASLELDVGGLTVIAVFVVLAGEQQASGIRGNLDGVNGVAAIGDDILLRSNTGPLGVGAEGAAPPVGGQILEHPVVLEVDGDHLGVQAAVGADAVDEVVAGSGDLGLSNDDGATVGADGASGQASLGAGSILASNSGHVGVGAAVVVGSVNGSGVGVQSEGNLDLTGQGQGSVVAARNSIAPVSPSSLVLIGASSQSHGDGPGAVTVVGHDIGSAPAVHGTAQVVVGVNNNLFALLNPGTGVPTRDGADGLAGINDHITGLIPLVAPVSSAAGRVHTHEDNIGVALGQFERIQAVGIGASTSNPLAVATSGPGPNGEPGIALQPVVIGLQINGGARREYCHRQHGQHHGETDQHSDQSLARFVHCVFLL